MGIEAGDTAELVGLRSRADLNGRRVEVRGQAAGKDGAPRLRVELRRRWAVLKVRRPTWTSWTRVP